MRKRNFVLALLMTFLALQVRGQAAVIISEFLAENDGGLVDQDGDTPDWIELFNNTGSPVNLAGWRLTDNPTNLAKWTFPATNIVADGYLIVFASGKDRATNGAQLHTSFQLQNGGGYLALVDSNGVIASEFNYPQQHRNVTYGPGTTNGAVVTLLAAGGAARWLVPADGALGATWTAPAFNDSSWNSAAMPLRYDVTQVGVPSGPALLSIDFNRRNTDLPTNTLAGFQTFVIASNVSVVAVQTQATVRTYGAFSITLSNTSPFGYSDRLRNTPVDSAGNTNAPLLRDFVFSQDLNTTGGLDITLAGLASNALHRMTIWSFDSGSGGNRVSDWSANGVVATNGYAFNGAVLPTSSSQYSFQFDTTSDSEGRVVVRGRRNPASVDATSPTPVASFGVFLNALQIAPAALAPVTNGNLAALAGQNSTLYTRQSFNVNMPALIAQVTLRVKYNDGFVAYLNGTEVARRNAPLTTAWNSAATATNSAAAPEDIPLPGAAGLLVSGTNVLAVQALNLSAGDPDFFLEPQVLAALHPLTNGYFATPTPGASNTAALYGAVADTKFSVDRGFYDGPFSLSITCATPGATIYFTTNGSAPVPGNGLLYSSPVSITGNSFIRAQAHLTGWVPSGIDTHSYIFLRDVLRQSNNIPGYPATWQASYPADYAMDSNIVNHPAYGPTLSNDLRSIPSLMLVSGVDGLWNSSTGIYPNATSAGLAWERAASVELIRGDGHTEFATTARLEMHGNASRDNVRTPKHSMHLGFNSDYGPTKLDYDWFGGGVTRHDSIVFRSCGFVDGWAGRYADNTIYTSSETGEQFRGLRYRPENTLYLRDVWMKESFRSMGWLSSRSSFAHLYLNGLYWGLYEPSEKYGSYYFSRHLGGEEAAWDVVVGEDNNGTPVLVDGSLTDWNSVLALVAAPIATEAAYAAVTNAVDIDNLIDYMMLHIFGESEDWPRHNWYAAHRRATNGVPATKFVFCVWDQELTLDRLVRRNRIDAGNNAGGAGEQYSPARIYMQCRNWPEFRLRFADRVHRHLFNGGALVPSNNVARLLASASVISNAVVGESARWGDARKIGVPAGQIGTSNTFTRNEWWQPEVDKTATNFFQKLTADNVARFQAGNLYPLLGAPIFNQFGGPATNGFALTMSHTNLAGTIYFTTDQTDPRVYGSGTVAPGAQAYAAPISFLTPTVVRARVFDGVTWSALAEAVFYPPQDLSKLALTEIMYRPLPFGAYTSGDLEFIELKNTGTNTLDLTGCGFSDGITFNFTNDTLLAPGQFFVLARNTAAMAARHPGAPVNGVFTGQLANNGEKLALAFQPGGTVVAGIFSVNYGTRAPWPVAPDGGGFSLVQKNPVTQAPDDGTKWRASAYPGGSPGADDPEPPVGPVVINEILTHTDLPAVDRIELFNPAATNVDLGGWFLTDDAGTPKKFRIPDGTTILAGGYVSFDESHFNPTPGTNNSFSLSSSGEQVYLFSGDAGTNLTGWSHGFDFGAAANGVTFGRYINSVGEEQFPAQISQTPNATNSGPRVGPVVINEIHFHPGPPENPAYDSFVELKNIAATNVALFDPARPTNTWKLEGLGFTFPTNVSVPPGGFVILVASNAPLFISNHSVPTNVPVFAYGPAGSLQFDGERLSLTRPDAPDSNGTPHIVTDSVRYNDRAPWPAAADGSGPSLQRKSSNQYGDDPINWSAAAPTPGRENADLDTDGDGMPDWWETLHGTQVNVPDANDDLDDDGYTNYQEYLAGTHPNDFNSRLRVERIVTAGTSVQFEFTAASNRTFTVQAKGALTDPTWLPLSNVPSAPLIRTIIINDQTTNGTRFYRLAVP